MEEGQWKGQPTSKVIKCNHKLYAQPFGNVLKCSAFSDIPKAVWVCLSVRVSVSVCQSVCVCVGGCRRFVLSTVPIFVVYHTPYALKINEVGCITLGIELVTDLPYWTMF